MYNKIKEIIFIKYNIEKLSTIILFQSGVQRFMNWLLYLNSCIKSIIPIDGNALPFPQKMNVKSISRETIQRFDPLVELAYSKEAFSNVGMLTGTVKLPCGIIHTIFGASAVYLGGVNVLTNIHCIEPWLTSDGDNPKGRLYTTIGLHFNIVGKNGEIIETYPLELSAKVHPKHKTSGCDTKLKYDIAILKLGKEIDSLDGMPLCFEDLDKVDLEGLYACGFGSNGQVNNLLSAIDGKKRATYVPLLMTHLPKLGSQKMFSGNYLAYLGKKIHTTQDKLKSADSVNVSETFAITENTTLESYEGGIRMGMSGGMLIDSQDRFVGIPTFSIVDVYQRASNPSLKSFFRFNGRVLRKLISSHLTKYISGLTYFPVPFLAPETGDLNVFAKFSESDIKDWLCENLD